MFLPINAYTYVTIHRYINSYVLLLNNCHKIGKVLCSLCKSSIVLEEYKINKVIKKTHQGEYVLLGQIPYYVASTMLIDIEDNIRIHVDDTYDNSIYLIFYCSL